MGGFPNHCANMASGIGKCHHAYLTSAMRLINCLVLWMLAATPSAFAVEERLHSPEIFVLLNDASLYAKNGQIEQIFQKSGTTFYLENGNSSQGAWKVENDQYCSQWPPNPSWACYEVLNDGDVVTFVSSSGSRFPMMRKK